MPSIAEITCPFCFPDVNRIFHAGELVLGLWDGYPVSPGHALLVPRRHVASWFDASSTEREELAAAVAIARTTILRGHRPDGFNIGINVGSAAGQTVFHLHIHVIPRYAGDVPDPRGGVRHVLPCKQPQVPATGSEPIIHDASAPWLSSLAEQRDLSAHKEDEEPGITAIPSRAAARSDAAAFGERILLLLDKGRFTTTYKYAVLLALIDLCLEQGSAVGGAASFTTQQLAEKIVELYWPQTAPYPGQKGLHVLAQHHGGQAEIVSAIQKFRERCAVSGAAMRQELAEIAERAGFDRHPERTLNVARTIYSRLPDDVRLWLRSREFVAMVAQRSRLESALGRLE
ncbi:HIT domain-containing protein [Candidatus Binatia bacterium]|nr:HIT domain-containing protein [Candidatus Binatia bacterium]